MSSCRPNSRNDAPSLDDHAAARPAAPCIPIPSHLSSGNWDPRCAEAAPVQPAVPVDAEKEAFLARPDIREAVARIDGYRHSLYADQFSYDCSVNPEGRPPEEFADAVVQARTAMVTILDQRSDEELSRLLTLTAKWEEGTVSEVATIAEIRKEAFLNRPNIAPASEGIRAYREALFVQRRYDQDRFNPDRHPLDHFVAQSEGVRAAMMTAFSSADPTDVIRLLEISFSGAPHKHGEYGWKEKVKDMDMVWSAAREAHRDLMSIKQNSSGQGHTHY